MKIFKKITTLFLSLIIVLGVSCGVLAEEAQGKIVSVTAVISNSQVSVDVIAEGFEEKNMAIAALLDENDNILCINSSKIKNEFQIVFPKDRLGTKVKLFLWRGVTNMQPLYEVVVTGVDNSAQMDFKTTLNFLQPGKYASTGQFEIEDDVVYMCRQGIIYKVDVSDISNPIVLFENKYSQTSVKLATGVQINGDYIYVGNRLYAAAYPTEDEEANLSAGSLVVLKKSDLSVVKTIPLGKKVSGMALYKNILIVNEQMLGWAIYDVSNPTEPVLLDEVDFARGAGIETQGGEIFEYEGKVYYAVAGFSDGIRMYDITEFVEYTENPKALSVVPEIGDDNFLWFYRLRDHGIGGNHTYDLTVKYPYVYATIAAMRTQKENPDRIQGILTLDITNITEAPATHTVSMIAVEDKNEVYTSSDTQPSIICRMGNMLVVNNDRKGIAYFSIGDTPHNPKYMGVYNPFEGSCVFRMMFDEKGRLFLTDGSGVDGEPRIYIVEGFK